MTSSTFSPRSGYTLPVFAVAAAKAALLCLIAREFEQSGDRVTLDLLDGTQAAIAIEQRAPLDANTALAICRSDPGDNLDLTRHTPVWAWVHLELLAGANAEHSQSKAASDRLILAAGEGVGRTVDGWPAIYRFARQLAMANLLPFLPADRALRVCFILPEGRALAQRTSNAAFGVLEGLALLGTSAIAQPLSAEAKLDDLRVAVQHQASKHSHLAFCIGANGQRAARQLGFAEEAIAQTGNWIGVLAIEAALLGVKRLTLVGYHGKLLKLAGGIFNTSSHLADARREILTTAAVCVDLPLDLVRAVCSVPTAEAAREVLVAAGCDRPVFAYLRREITRRLQEYVRKYAARDLDVGVVLCDRAGQPLDLGTE